MNRKLILPVLIVILTALLTNLLGDWWSSRDNNLYNNDRWIVGKDTGKYLFYTYDYMFAPLKRNRVKLNSHMGFQELLFHEAETGRKRLKKLTFDMVVGGGTYIWVLLRKEGLRTFACRFSYRDDFPSGFFTFNNLGEMVEYIPFPAGMPRLAHTSHQTAELELKENQWIVSIDGKQVGSAPDPEFKNGYFGFRGSGVLRQKNSVGAIAIEWLRDGQLQTEYENFAAPTTSRLHWAVIFACALLLAGLRFLRNLSISTIADGHGAQRYMILDMMIACLVLFIIVQGTGLSEIGQLGLSFLLLEVFSFAAFAWLIKKHGLNRDMRLSGLIIFILIFCSLAAVSLARHGDWAGRKQYQPAAAASAAHPEVFVQYPEPVPGPAYIIEDEPFDITFGHPYTTGDKAFNQQVISIDFIMPAATTFDICFQQQSFFTRGDADGEPLPLQRRLVRLSTVKNVPTGVATQTGRQPEPFIPILGQLLTGQLNTLNIRSTGDGLTVTLNGQETPIIPSMNPLGYGETLLMTYENPVSVQRMEIRTENNQAARMSFLPFFGILAFPIIALSGGLLFRLMGGTTLKLTCTGAVAVAFPILIYLAAILFVDPVRLPLMPVDRKTLLNFAIAASCWSMLYWIPIHYRRIRHPALPANLFLILFIFSVTFLIWDIYLPPEHPLKTSFAEDAAVPGELVKTNMSKVPWYASNRRIGGNLYVWRQQFGGRWIPLEKKPGNIRAFVLGGSQAWGSGAGSTADTFSGLLNRRCREAGLPAEVLNAGVNGAGVARVSDVFFGIILRYDPDIVILDIGLNDTAARRNKKNIDDILKVFKKIVQACSRRNIELILVHEPTSSEGPFELIEEMYAGFADISHQFGFQVVDARPVFARADPMEITWWDVAHLTPRGHLIMADIIFPALEVSIKKRLSGQPTVMEYADDRREE